MNDELFTQTAPTNLLELTTPKSKSSKSNKRKINNNNSDDDSSNSTTIDQQTYDKSLDLLKDSSVYLQRPQKKWRYTLQTSSASQPLLQNPLLSAEPEFPQLQQQIESIQDRYTKALESRQELREQTERETQLERERETVHLHEVQPLLSAKTASEQKLVLNDKCIELDCLNRQVYLSCGLCRTHYNAQHYRQKQVGIENNLRTTYSEERKQELISICTTAPCLQTILMGTTCSTSDCEGRLYARNLCKRHYQAANRLLRKQKTASDNVDNSQK